MDKQEKEGIQPDRRQESFRGKQRMPKARIRIFGGSDGSICELDDIWEAEGVLHLEAWIFRMDAGGRKQSASAERKISCQAEEEVGRLVRRLIEANPNRVIVCTEIGYGLVPVDAFDRAYRETVGRICTVIAGKAAAVDRIVCGINTRIKEM